MLTGYKLSVCSKI